MLELWILPPHWHSNPVLQRWHPAMNIGVLSRGHYTPEHRYRSCYIIWCRGPGCQQYHCRWGLAVATRSRRPLKRMLVKHRRPLPGRLWSTEDPFQDVCEAQKTPSRTPVKHRRPLRGRLWSTEDPSMTLVKHRRPFKDACEAQKTPSRTPVKHRRPFEDACEAQKTLRGHLWSTEDPFEDACDAQKTLPRTPVTHRRPHRGCLRWIVDSELELIETFENLLEKRTTEGRQGVHLRVGRNGQGNGSSSDQGTPLLGDKEARWPGPAAQSPYNCLCRWFRPVSPGWKRTRQSCGPYCHWLY